MTWPITPPISPMLSKPAPNVPQPDSVPGGLHYEPKWDGFRCMVFKAGAQVELMGRKEPITRYFPEVVEAARTLLPEEIVLDGEIVLASDDRLDFDALQQRIHPAASRVNMLAEQTPASYVAFDLLGDSTGNLMSEPFTVRRTRLVEALATTPPPFFVTPATTDHEVASRWFSQFEGAGLDGLVAKPLADPYQPGKRALIKIKHERTADCVVAGYRIHKSGDVVGSLLLGLYDNEGSLHHVGVAASFTAARRRELIDELAPYVTEFSQHPWNAERADEAGRRRPGSLNRWNAGKDMSFVPLRPELVVEVAYDQLQGNRFRHTARFRRWRTDREAASCTYEQLDQPVAYDLADVLRPSKAG